MLRVINCKLFYLYCMYAPSKYKSRRHTMLTITVLKNPVEPMIRPTQPSVCFVFSCLGSNTQMQMFDLDVAFENSPVQNYESCL